MRSKRRVFIYVSCALVYCPKPQMVDPMSLVEVPHTLPCAYWFVFKVQALKSYGTGNYSEQLAPCLLCVIFFPMYQNNWISLTVSCEGQTVLSCNKNVHPWKDIWCVRYFDTLSSPRVFDIFLLEKTKVFLMTNQCITKWNLLIVQMCNTCTLWFLPDMRLFLTYICESG